MSRNFPNLYVAYSQVIFKSDHMGLKGLMGLMGLMGLNCRDQFKPFKLFKPLKQLKQLKQLDFHFDTPPSTPCIFFQEKTAQSERVFLKSMLYV